MWERNFSKCPSNQSYKKPLLCEHSLCIGILLLLLFFWNMCVHVCVCVNCEERTLVEGHVRRLLCEANLKPNLKALQKQICTAYKSGIAYARSCFLQRLLPQQHAPHECTKSYTYLILTNLYQSIEVRSYTSVCHCFDPPPLHTSLLLPHFLLARPPLSLLLCARWVLPSFLLNICIVQLHKQPCVVPLCLQPHYCWSSLWDQKLPPCQGENRLSLQGLHHKYVVTCFNPRHCSSLVR